MVQIKPNSYDKAIRNLDQQGFETFSPVLELTKRKKTRFLNKLVPLFQGYMFVAFDPNNMLWHKINSTLGVTKILNFNGKPEPMPIDLILGLKNRCDIDGKLQHLDQLKKGVQIDSKN